ncbi:MAG: hypothetical protein ACQBVK_02070 [Candidatus Phytoplasma sp. TWB_XP]
MTQKTFSWWNGDKRTAKEKQETLSDKCRCGKNHQVDKTLPKKK